MSIQISRMSAKGLIALDLDFTLYNTDILMQACAQTLSQFGLLEQDYFDTYPQARGEGKPYYDLRTHADLLAVQVGGDASLSSEIVAAWHEQIDLVSTQALDLDELSSFARALGAEYEFAVLSLGESDFQNRKIEACGLYSILPRESVHIVDNKQGKMDKAGVWLKSFAKVVFVNDSVRQNTELRDLSGSEILAMRLLILEIRRKYKDPKKQREQKEQGIEFITDLDEQTIRLCKEFAES